MYNLWRVVIVAVLVLGVVCPAAAIEQGVEADAEAGAISPAATIYDELQSLGGAVPIVSRPAPTAPAVTPPTVPVVVPPTVPPVTPPVAPIIITPAGPTPPTAPITTPRTPATPVRPAATPSNPVARSAVPAAGTTRPATAPLSATTSPSSIASAPAGELPPLSELPPTGAPGMTGRTIGGGELEPLPLYTELTTPPLDAGSGAPSQTVVLAGEITPSGANPSAAPAPTAAAVAPLSDQVRAILETVRDYLVIIAIVLAGAALVSLLLRVLYQRWKARAVAPPLAARPGPGLDVTIPAATPSVPVTPPVSIADLDHLFDQALNRGTVPAAPAQLTISAPIPQTQPLTTPEETMQEAPGLLDYEEMKYRQVYQYASEGLDPVEIARKTGFGEGEIGLVLDLYRLQNG